jgi:hypothetical protein
MLPPMFLSVIWQCCQVAVATAKKVKTGCKKIICGEKLVAVKLTVRSNKMLCYNLVKFRKFL